MLRVSAGGGRPGSGGAGRHGLLPAGRRPAGGHGRHLRRRHQVPRRGCTGEGRSGEDSGSELFVFRKKSGKFVQEIVAGVMNFYMPCLHLVIAIQVFHCGRFEGAGEGCGHGFKEGESVSLEVDAERRSLNSR